MSGKNIGSAQFLDAKELNSQSTLTANVFTFLYEKKIFVPES